VITPDGRSAFWIEPSRENGDDVVARVDLETGTRTFLTRGHQAFDLHGLSADGKALYATTNRDFVLGRQLDAIAVEGDAPTRTLTPERGVHQVEVAKDGTFVDVHSASDRLPTAVLRGDDGAVRARLPVGRDDDLEALDLRLPRLVSLMHDGVELHGAVLPPRDHDPARRYPLVLMVYGGPGVQTVLDRWSPRPLWQHLADRGFFVAQFDNRGSSGRGGPFAQAIHGRLGEVELADQEAALRHLLAAEPSIDAGRVGIYGHSYGGFLSAMAMLTRPGLFRAAVSGSPVTDWRLYDTGYTERYMGLPDANADGYAASRLPDRAPALEGRLFLLHGFMDENVHLEHTARLVDALVAAGKPFDLLLFPSERHGYRSPVARSYANRRVVDFLVENLAPDAGADR
jgi:dipeptidyl-peptidase-4